MGLLGASPEGFGGRGMYALIECFVITGIAFCLGAGLFLAVATVMLLQAGIRRAVVNWSLPMTQAAAEGGLNADPIAVPEPSAQ
jgi:hypothetical protein